MLIIFDYIYKCAIIFTIMEILKEIQSRKSIRNFKNTAIEKASLERILEAGRLSPSAKNRQPWRFVVIDNNDLKARVQVAAYGQDHVGNAGVIVAACSTNIEYEMPNGQKSYPIDISFAVSYMMLQAEHEGLGSCVITTYDEEELKSFLTIPYSMRIVLLLLIGHTDERLITRDRKSLNQIVAYNHW